MVAQIWRSCIYVLLQSSLQVFPWLDVIISLREPISRALSMQAHMADKHNDGCLTRWVG